MECYIFQFQKNGRRKLLIVQRWNQADKQLDSNDTQCTVEMNY